MQWQRYGSYDLRHWILLKYRSEFHGNRIGGGVRNNALAMDSTMSFTQLSQPRSLSQAWSNLCLGIIYRIIQSLEMRHAANVNCKCGIKFSHDVHVLTGNKQSSNG